MGTELCGDGEDMNRCHWRVFKLNRWSDGASWCVRSPEPHDILNRFYTFTVALRFAVLMSSGKSVMLHPFEINHCDGRCLICEEHEDCHVKTLLAMDIR